MSALDDALITLHGVLSHATIRWMSDNENRLEHIARASEARAELAALRERVAKLEAALVKADEMAKAADTATVWRDKESLDALDLALAAFAEANPALDNDAREATK